MNFFRYNGIGGNGGSIFVRASDKLDFDKFYNRHKPDDEKWVELKAESGESSRQTKLVGRNGKDLVIFAFKQIFIKIFIRFLMFHWV